MLVKPPMEKLLPKADNRYTLAILVAKRARQLVDGARPLVESDSPNLVTLACEELALNRIACVHGILHPYIPLRPDVEAARQAARTAAVNASAAEAIKEELELNINANFNDELDASDARIIADNLVQSLDLDEADPGVEASDMEVEE
jgi:DNA-directed RNA polymerase subunit omega